MPWETKGTRPVFAELIMLLDDMSQELLPGSPQDCPQGSYDDYLKKVDQYSEWDLVLAFRAYWSTCREEL